MEIKLQVAGLAETQAWLKDLAQNQVPYVTSRTVNAIALRFQREQRAVMARHFTERRAAWVNMNVKLTHRSTKNDPAIYATVAIESPGGGDRSDILGKFEEGGDKTPKGKNIAVPDEVRTTKTGIISKANRPKALAFQLWGAGPRATVFRGAKRTFMILPNSGQGGGIFQRVGRRGSSSLRMLYSFAKSVRIDQQLGFYATARRVVATDLAAIAEAEIVKAIATAK